MCSLQFQSSSKSFFLLGEFKGCRIHRSSGIVERNSCQNLTFILDNLRFFRSHSLAKKRNYPELLFSLCCSDAWKKAKFLFFEIMKWILEHFYSTCVLWIQFHVEKFFCSHPISQGSLWQQKKETSPISNVNILPYRRRAIEWGAAVTHPKTQRERQSQPRTSTTTLRLPSRERMHVEIDTNNHDVYSHITYEVLYSSLLFLLPFVCSLFFSGCFLLTGPCRRSSTRTEYSFPLLMKSDWSAESTLLQQQKAWVQWRGRKFMIIRNY